MGKGTLVALAAVFAAAVACSVPRPLAPVNTWAKLRDAIETVSADDLAGVAQKYLDPARAQLVVLGDVQRFRSDLDALGIAQVEVRPASR